MQDWLIDWSDERISRLCDRAGHMEEGAACEAAVCEAIELGWAMAREDAFRRWAESVARTEGDPS